MGPGRDRGRKAQGASALECLIQEIESPQAAGRFGVEEGLVVQRAAIVRRPSQQLVMAPLRSAQHRHRIPRNLELAEQLQGRKLPSVSSSRTDILVGLAPGFHGPTQHLQVPPGRGFNERFLIPRTPVTASILQHLQVPFSGSHKAGPFVPWAVVFPCPHKHFRVSCHCSKEAHPFIPFATVGVSPLEHLQMPAFGCLGTSPFVPWAAILPRPLQHFKLTKLCGNSACVAVPRAAVLSSPLKGP
mmetsp:Transcript_37712/g.106559  ORF Transcript_37712/g.106559 Transcript_37712/m.106559 type:complete len:244 (-) Transcript_37712:848-1579(-)